MTVKVLFAPTGH